MKRNKNTKLSITKKILITILSIIVLIILSGGIYLAFLSNKVDRVEIDRSEVTDTGKEIAKEDADVITIGLFGTDYSGVEYGASDSTMILSINTKTNEVKLMSLMRDIYLDLPDGGKSNLNYTMSTGGPSLMLKTINYNFNLNVDKFIQINLHNLPKVIDILGGVTLTITPDELNYINSYIAGNDKENGTITPPILSAGTQLLNGTQASAYCRIRYTEGRDYKRTERQRDVLEALFTEFKTISPSEIPSLANNLLPLVSTNLSNTEILSISSKVLGMGINNISQARFPLDEDHTTVWTDMYHMIIDLPKTTEEIHKFIYSK